MIVAAVRVFRDALALAMEREDGVVVVGTAVSAGDALETAPRLHPDVIALDVATAEPVDVPKVIEQAQDASVVAMSVGESEAELIEWAETGVAGCVPRDASVEEFAAVVKAVGAGDFPCSPAIAGVLLRRVATLAGDAAPSRGAGRLTPREREILELVQAGCANKEIARRLRIELSTVKNHMRNILRKLGVRRRADAAALLRRSTFDSRFGAGAPTKD